jgi:hypothetical protein
MNVVDINKNLPHRVSTVVCLKCYRRWVAVRPTTVPLKELECDDCGAGYVIETGEQVE